MSADPLPTWQINGVVWAQVIVGNTVYATGSFTKARPPGVAAGGAGEVAANNIFAYDLTTGNRVASFSHTLNAQGLALTASPDGSRVYVGGDFTSVDGAAHSHVAAFNTANGQLVTTFNPSVSAKVQALAATASTLYVGGNFSKANGQTRNHLAAYNTAGTLQSWAASADDGVVAAMVMAPDNSRVIVGGGFTTLNGQSANGMGSVDATTGATLPWAANQGLQDGGSGSSIDALSTDGSQIYGAGYAFKTGRFEGTFSADPFTGNVNWANDCHGDTYSVANAGGVLYEVSHTHSCEWIGDYHNSDPWTINMHHALAFDTEAQSTYNSGPDDYGWDFRQYHDSMLLNWFPVLKIGTYTGINQAAWSVTGNSQYVVLGGEFPSVNGTAQQGLTRFAISSIAPNKVGPARAPGAPAPSAQSFSAGTARVAWQAPYDMDNRTLTYNVYRSGTTQPVYTTTGDSTFWNYPMMGYVDKGVTSGASYTYTIKVSDPFGNTLSLPKTNSVTIKTGTVSDYAADVLNDGASDFWRLGEPSGTAVYDSAGFNDAAAQSGVTRGAPGAINGDSDTASTFDGSGSGYAVTNSTQDAPTDLTVGAWIKTTTTSGGKILGYGNSATGLSSNYDRHVYMDNSGHITFGIYNNATYTITSPKAYNDGSWHQIVGTLDSTNGMTLYIDGKKVGANQGTTVGQPYTGYWRIGGDNLGGWPNQPSSVFFNGSIDDVAIYPSVLNLGDVQQQYVDSGRTLNGPQAPTDAYGKAVYNAGPDLYWRLDDAQATTAHDSSANAEDGVYSGGVTVNQPGGVSGTSDTAAAFNGADGTVGSTDTGQGPSVYSEELWFKTNTDHGGKLIGFGDTQSGYSGSYDRHVYMENSGQLTFGVWTGQTNTATSPSSYNDGQWHYMVATQGSDGMHLYVDGAQVADNPQTDQQPYVGYWRVGGDSDWGGDSAFFNGTIDEAAVYSYELTPQAIASHYAIGGGTVQNQPPHASFTHAESGLKASFDGSGSGDSDGSITSYAWDFGDGIQGSGVSPDHTYGATGDYSVTLTVTDDDNATNSSTQTFHVTNAAPHAVFGTQISARTVSTDGTGSSDSDGTIVSYDWDWGDGSGHDSGSGSVHTYGADGTYPVTLKVTDNAGGVDTVEHDVTVDTNQSPHAVFTTTIDGLGVSADGGNSSDPDGTIASYDWDWGDNTAVSHGATPNHTYAGSGTYTITLTVHDDDGATGSTQHDVTVTSNAPQLLASDDFGRSVTKGWGNADTGGAWTTTGAKTNFAVAGGVGRITMPTAPIGPSVSLGGVSTSDADVTVKISTESMPTGSGSYVSLLGRDKGSNGSYRAVLNLAANGSVNLGLTRVDTGGTARIVAPTVIPGLTYGAGTVLDLRMAVVGTGPSQLMAKVWKDGTTEPASWQVSGSDSAAAMQAAGAVSLMSYLSANSVAPITTDFDALRVYQTTAQQVMGGKLQLKLAAADTTHKSRRVPFAKRTSLPLAKTAKR